MKLRFHQLSVAQKLALICLLFLMPDGVMLYFVITGFHGHIRFAEWEQKGNEYQRPLMELLYRLPQHAELAGRVRRGDAQAGGALGRKQAEIDAAFDSLAQVDARLGAALQFTDEGLAKRKREHFRVATVRQEWGELKAGLAQVTPEDAAAQHRHLVADLRAMITHVGDLSNLILDPDLDSYYLMDVTLLALPQMQQRLGEVVEYGAAALERPGMSMADRQRLVIFADLLREVDADHIAASIRTSVTEDANFYGESATLQARLPSAYTQWFAATDEFIKLTARIAQADAAGVGAEEFRVAGEQARAASSKFWTIAAAELDQLLQQRIEAFKRKRNVSLLVAACAFVAAVSFVSFITRSISGPLQRQTAALIAANEALRREIAERDRVEAALRRSQADLEAAQAAALTMMADVQESRRKTELAYADLQREVACRQQAEAQFLQSQKLEAIGQLAGGIAHDFNNILAAMLMQSDLITDPVSTPEEVQEGVREIQSGARRAANLTRQLLLFSRKQVMQAKELDLNDVVASLSKMLQRIIGEDVRLEFHPHPVALAIHADAGMLDQVLLNLAVNARDAMPNGGRVRIETGEQILDATLARQQPDGVPGRYVWLSVSDTGTGIPPEVLPRIFEPFYTTKEAGKGSGLGLATVFGIVKQHQGWVRVASEYGHGATFTIYLPASTSRSGNPNLAVVPPKPRGGTETILLVEDEPGVRMITRTLLVRHGYRVVEAESGLAALKIWPSCCDQAALLLTDLVMPEGVSGQQLAARLQTDRPRLKVIFMSGYSSDIAGQDLHLQTGQNFLQKPFASHLLLELVRRTLDG